jgi:hypothetical protein
MNYLELLRTTLIVTTALALTPGCSSSDADSDAGGSSSGTDSGGEETGDGDGDAEYMSCDAATLAGRFTVKLQDEYTQVEGQVFDAPDPTPKVELETEGSCKLLKVESYDCDPGCDSESECTADGCVPEANPVSVGAVSISGLAAEVQMDPNVVNFYLNLGELPHPGFEPGALLTLSAEGSEVDEAFEIRAQGGEDLVILSETIEVAQDLPVILDWEPPTGDADTRVHLDLDIGHHGGSPARIECEVEDTGHFEIPASLVNPLFEFGIAGFPAINMTRRSVATATLGDRCVEFMVAPHGSKEAVSIEGLISCNTDDECPEGMTCLADLSCG